METRRRALGRGLEDLFNNEPIEYEKIEEKIMETTPKEEIVKINLKELRSNPYQPRKNFDEQALQELASSIKEHGVFQPIIAKKSIKGYEIIAGERRVKASIIAGLEEIPAIIRTFDDKEMMEIALLENLQRENLNAIEEAIAYKKLLTSLELTQEALSKRLGKSRSHITNMLGLLNLSDKVQDKINNKELTMGHARVLSKLSDATQQENLANKIVESGLSVRETELISSAPESNLIKTNPIPQKRQSTNEYKDLENTLCDRLGTKVKIKNHKIEIGFVNTNDLNRLLEIMNIDK